MKTQTTSLLALQNQLRDDLELFHGLHPVVNSSHTSSTLLSHLYDLACQSNSIGSTSLHKFILDLFLPALETYFRPLHAWMTNGDLDVTTHPDFFIISTSTTDGHPIHHLVHTTSDLSAPKFMLHIVNRVLAAGKTVDFVKRMQPVVAVDNDTFTTFLQDRLDDGGVNPFDQAFGNTLEVWISRKYEVASAALRRTLNDGSELWRQLDGIHGVYCGLSHHAMGLFIRSLFQKVGFEVRLM
jgi:Gamma tubulin complex component N-terminal